ncbi:hypothetical protein D3C87_1386310 [compost metagenome]
MRQQRRMTRWCSCHLGAKDERQFLEEAADGACRKARAMPLQRGDVCPHAQFAQRAVCRDPDRFGTVGSDARRQQRDPVEHARGKGVPGGCVLRMGRQIGEVVPRRAAYAPDRPVAPHAAHERGDAGRDHRTHEQGQVGTDEAHPIGGGRVLKGERSGDAEEHAKGRQGTGRSCHVAPNHQEHRRDAQHQHAEVMCQRHDPQDIKSRHRQRPQQRRDELVHRRHRIVQGGEEAAKHGSAHGHGRSEGPARRNPQRAREAGAQHRSDRRPQRKPSVQVKHPATQSRGAPQRHRVPGDAGVDIAAQRGAGLPVRDQVLQAGCQIDPQRADPG